MFGGLVLNAARDSSFALFMPVKHTPRAFVEWAPRLCELDISGIAICDMQAVYGMMNALDQIRILRLGWTHVMSLRTALGRF